MQKWIIIAVIFIILILTTVIVLNVDIETEYTPETEIEETELRKTIISLYFVEKDTKEIVKESRLIDSKELIINPYDEVLNMLIIGPENSNNERIIPENTRILETKLDKDCLIINFSSEFSEGLIEEEQKNKAIDTIYQSLKEFTEINSVRILVDNNDITNSNESIVSNQIMNQTTNEIVNKTANDTTNQSIENTVQNTIS